MRILFTSTAGSGHFHPLVPFIDACAGRGDDVLVVGLPKLEATLAARDQPYRIGGEPSAAELAAIFERVSKATPDEGRRIVNRELFGRLCTAAMLPAVGEACQEWRPDLVLHEPCEYASVVVAGRLGIPHAQVAISAAEVEEFSLGVAAPVLEPYGGGESRSRDACDAHGRRTARRTPAPHAHLGSGASRSPDIYTVSARRGAHPVGLHSVTKRYGAGDRAISRDRPGR